MEGRGVCLFQSRLDTSYRGVADKGEGTLERRNTLPPNHLGAPPVAGDTFTDAQTVGMTLLWHSQGGAYARRDAGSSGGLLSRHWQAVVPTRRKGGESKSRKGEMAV